MAQRRVVLFTRAIFRLPRWSKSRAWRDRSFWSKSRSSRRWPNTRRQHMPYSTITPVEAKPVANYKMATRLEGGRLLYISGQVAWDAAGNIVGKGDIRAQAKQVFENLRGVLRAAGGDLTSLMKITTYITKLEDFPAVAQARSEVFQ